MTTVSGTTSPTAATAPERSLNQRMDALARANEIRIQRAQLKRDLQAGRPPVPTPLRAPPEYVETAKVFDMLLAVPKYGRVKVNRSAHRRIARARRSAALERQRSELISLLHRLARQRPRGKGVQAPTRVPARERRVRDHGTIGVGKER
jgi:hypothetical protein